MTKIARLFFSALGIAYLINFWVLHDQALLLFGRNGLMPIAGDLPLIKAHFGLSAYWQFPTLFWLNSSDAALQAGAWVGLALSLLLILRLWPKVTLVLLWLLFLSYSTVGRTFYSFQWDILMLEATLLALFLPSQKGVNPHPLSVWLLRLLAFKLHFESGVAKVWAGKLGGWLDGSAMQYYYDTAPIPTWLGWWAHQLPLWFHRGETYLTLIAEIGVPLLIFFGRRARVIAFLILFPLQISIGLTANYGIFNFMTLATLLFLLEDKDLKWIGWRTTKTTDDVQPPTQQSLHPIAKLAGAFIIFFSILNYTCFLNPTLAQTLDPFHLQRHLAPFRSVNNYHLFASITRTRLVAEIQGTNDGITWKPYRFHYYPGDLSEPPKFVAPYHPRLAFRLWFLTLSPRGEDWVYFSNLLKKIFHSPETASAYFAQNPFPEKPPTALRFVIYQYNMSSLSHHKQTATYWTRQEISHSQLFFPDHFKKD